MKNIIFFLSVGLMLAQCGFCQYVKLYEHFFWEGKNMEFKPEFGKCVIIPNDLGVSSLKAGGTFSSGPSQYLGVRLFNNDRCDPKGDKSGSTCIRVSGDVGWFKGFGLRNIVGRFNDQIRSIKFESDPSESYCGMIST